MKRGMPLSVRILLWALLNLVLLAALGWGLFLGQFGMGLDTLLAGQAGDRLQGMADVLAGELARTPQAEWDTVLARNAAAYELTLTVVRPDGKYWAGTGWSFLRPCVRGSAKDRPASGRRAIPGPAPASQEKGTGFRTSLTGIPGGPGSR